MRGMVWVGLVLLAGCRQEKGPELYVVDAATAGEIRGEVVFGGAADEAVVIDMEQDPGCQELYAKEPKKARLIVTGEEGRLGNVFVYVKKGLEGKKFSVPNDAARIEQRGCWFEPRVVGMQAGQTVEVINSDPVTHNIHPEPKLNREWNQSQAPEDGPLKRKFAQPEVMIRVKCNVHRWMRAWVGVVEHPYFAVTGKDGKFVLKNVPPGDYTLVAWHEKLGEREAAVKVGPRGTVEQRFEMK
jgi:plastocyanin